MTLRKYTGDPHGNGIISTVHFIGYYSISKRKEVQRLQKLPGLGPFFCFLFLVFPCMISVRVLPLEQLYRANHAISRTQEDDTPPRHLLGSKFVSGQNGCTRRNRYRFMI